MQFSLINQGGSYVIIKIYMSIIYIMCGDSAQLCLPWVWDGVVFSYSRGGTGQLCDCLKLSDTTQTLMDGIHFFGRLF